MTGPLHDRYTILTRRGGTVAGTFPLVTGWNERTQTLLEYLLDMLHPEALDESWRRFRL